VRGDCSVRIGGSGFSPQQIADCVEREGLLSLEIDLPSGSLCGCATCQATPRSAQAVLLFQEILGLIHQAKALGAERCLLVDSEPASYPNLLQLIDDLRDRGMAIELFCNSTAISETTARFLRERRVDTVVRLDSLNAALHDRLAGDARAHQTAIAAINNLKRSGYGGTGAPRLAVGMEICNENLSGVPDLWRWARSQEIEPYVQIIKPAQSAGEKPKSIAPDAIRQLFEELARIDQVEFHRNWPTPPSLTGRSCKRHLYACHVTACGNIYACVGVTIPAGNIRLEPLHEILRQSEVIENLRAFHQKVKEPCRTCSQTTDCYGCRGSAYQLTGDYLAGDQLCWKADGIHIESLPTSVENLIPHGNSIRVIDRLVQIGDRRSKTEYVVPHDSQMVDDPGVLDELAFIEMIAQSFAATHGFNLSEQERRTHRGLLLGVKDFLVVGEARVGDRLTIAIHKVTRFGDFGVVEGDIRHENGDLIASAQVKIWRANSNGLGTVTA
jgi:radical SAM protein with 4Fe4S-binding SPASM domain